MNVDRLKQLGASISRFAMVLLIASVLLLTFFLAQSKMTGTEPAIAGRKIYIVMSGSMEPALKVGSIVVVQALAAEEVEPGDIITFSSDHSPSVTTHRVQRVDTENGLLFYTKGDANEVQDPMPVRAHQLVGTVLFAVPYLGYMFAYARTTQGLMTLFGLATLVVGAELIHNYITCKRLDEQSGHEEVGADLPPDETVR